jgi:hypothetical protein
MIILKVVILIFAFTIVFGSCFSRSVDGPKSSNEKVIDWCDLIKSPETHHAKTVTVRARVFNGIEGTTLFGPECINQDAWLMTEIKLNYRQLDPPELIDGNKRIGFVEIVARGIFVNEARESGGLITKYQFRLIELQSVKQIRTEAVN